MSTVLILLFVLNHHAFGSTEGMVKIPAGQIKSFFRDEGQTRQKVPSFYIDKYPVTNAQFDEFVKKNPEYNRSRIPRLFAEPSYLKHWSGDQLSMEDRIALGNQPVVNVSWTPARAFCRAQGKRLPTILEWEYAADVWNADEQKKIMAWYGETNKGLPGDTGKGKPNRFGLHDMHGLIWEWVEDFNSVMISSDSRSKGERTEGLYCGGGSVNATDSGQYATFMRYAFRSGLKADYANSTLGFRCVRNGDAK